MERAIVWETMSTKAVMGGMLMWSDVLVYILIDHLGLSFEYALGIYNAGIDLWGMQAMWSLQ